MDEREKALLVGIHLSNVNEDDFELSMEELASLADACYMDVVGTIVQNLEQPNKAIYIGPGKIDEVKEYAYANEADIVIFDNTLSPSQIRNLQDKIGLPIMDRTGLILDIFDSRAKTREARLQVEVAKLQYMLPRLVGLHEALSRQGGGGGSRANKGAGEKKLELDKRKLEHRLSELRRELKEIKNERITQRKRRSETGELRVALVGYTNAGKSTLMNAMLESFYKSGNVTAEKMVFEKDMLFATLDTTVRRIEPKDHQPFLLSDTVGFISNLPHNLVEAFHSTLEEAIESDLLIEVVDYSDVNHNDQIRVTDDTLKSLEASEIPRIYVYNKCDMCMDEEKLPIIRDNKIYMSAKARIGLLELLELMDNVLSSMYKEGEFLIPYSKGHIISYFNNAGVVKETEYLESGTRVIAKLRGKDYEKYKEFLK